MLRAQAVPLLLTLGLLAPSWRLPAQTPTLPREALVQDARALLRLLEEAHPDPYGAFGGRMALHRAFQERIRAIPPEGLSVPAFHLSFAPLLARLQDGHTRLRPALQGLRGPGIPLRFKIVGSDLVVMEGERLGFRLESVEGIPLEALRARMGRLQGCENPSGELDQVLHRLGSAQGLKDLLPDWAPGAPLLLGFLRPDGSREGGRLAPGAPARAGSRSSRVLGLPALSSSLAWGFLDPAGRTAVLRLRDCVHFRENAGLYLSLPHGQGRAMLEKGFVERRGRRPKDDAELKAFLPSALETFSDLARAMKAKGTRTLLVDLRENDGGNSLLGDLLVYVLHGVPGMRKLGGAWSVARYSPLLVEDRGARYQAVLDEGLSLGPGDYDFREERECLKAAPDPSGWRESLKAYPELKEELASLSRAGIYAPPRIVALTTPGTFSAGFDAVLALRRNGAQVAGTPSAQAPNCFIDGLGFTLERTGLQGSISFQAQYTFPPGAPEGRMLPCDRPLTYEKFKAYGFDPEAEILLAMEGE